MENIFVEDNIVRADHNAVLFLVFKTQIDGKTGLIRLVAGNAAGSKLCIHDPLVFTRIGDIFVQDILIA